MSYVFNLLADVNNPEVPVLQDKWVELSEEEEQEQWDELMVDVALESRAFGG